jgi:hypothetical protein
MRHGGPGFPVLVGRVADPTYEPNELMNCAFSVSVPWRLPTWISHSGKRVSISLTSTSVCLSSERPAITIFFMASTFLKAFDGQAVIDVHHPVCVESGEEGSGFRSPVSKG